MKNLFLVFFFLLCTCCAVAQDAVAVTALPGEIEPERSRIQTERSFEEARYQTEEAKCYARFVVADCIRKLRVQRREVLDQLHRQEAVLNDADRKRKALSQIEQINEKSSPQRLEDAAAKRLEAVAAQQERVDSASQKAADAAHKKSTPVAGSTTQSSFAQSRSSEDIAKEKRQYDIKLKEAQEHKASQLKINLEKSGTLTKPLPVAP